MNANYERLRRWRLILGADSESDGEGRGAGSGAGVELDAEDATLDAALEALYGEERKGGLGGSAPKVARWLGDIRRFFPAPVVRVMQQDAIERLNLRQLLLEPELMAAIEPDVNMVTKKSPLAQSKARGQNVPAVSD